MRFKALTFFILIFECSVWSMGQEKYLVEVPKYSFIKYDSNYIKHYNDSSALDGFFSKLKSTINSKRHNVNIMHVGGSHIQADIWSGTVRTNFQMMEPEMKGERGMVFPLHIARTNNPSNYYTEYTGEWEKCRSAEKSRACDLGLLGYRVRTYDSLTTFKTYCYDEYYPLDYETNCVKIYYDVHPKSFVPFIVDNGERVEMQINEELGYAEYGFDSYQDTVFFEILKTNENQEYFELYGLQLENDDPGVVYQNIGINGADVPSYIHSKRLEDHLKTVQVDLVIFSIGINDAYSSTFTAESYKSHYDTLIQTFKRVYPDINILFTTNNDSRRYGKPNKRIYEVRAVMEQLCKEHNAAMWDMFEVMGGFASMNKWYYNNLAKKDRIHFNAEGYRIIGDLMFNAIIKDYNRYLKNDLN